MKKTYNVWTAIHHYPRIAILGLMMILMAATLSSKFSWVTISLGVSGGLITFWACKKLNSLSAGKSKMCSVCHCDLDDDNRVREVEALVCNDCYHRHFCKVRKD